MLTKKQQESFITYLENVIQNIKDDKVDIEHASVSRPIISAGLVDDWLSFQPSSLHEISFGVTDINDE